MRSGRRTACSGMSYIWVNGRTVDRRCSAAQAGALGHPLGGAATGLPHQPREDQHGHRVNR